MYLGFTFPWPPNYYFESTYYYFIVDFNKWDDFSSHKIDALENHKWVEDSYRPASENGGTVNKPIVKEKIEQRETTAGRETKYSKHWYPRPLSKGIESCKHFDSSCGHHGLIGQHSDRHKILELTLLSSTISHNLTNRRWLRSLPPHHSYYGSLYKMLTLLFPQICC